MTNENTQLILTELRLLREDFNRSIRDTSERLACLETDSHALMGNGQPGRIATLEAQVDSLKKWRWTMAGVCTAIWFGFSVFVEWLVKK